MSTRKEICEEVIINKDNIQLEVTHRNEEFNVLIEGEEYNILKTEDGFNVFKKLSKIEGKNLLERIKETEEKKINLQVEINKQEYKKEHCNEFNAQAEFIPCPLPRAEVEKLFKSVGLTPPALDSSICRPSQIM